MDNKKEEKNGETVKKEEIFLNMKTSIGSIDLCIFTLAKSP